MRNAAARTRIVSGGELWPSQRELSRHFKCIACARIPEFESYQPSQAVQSLWAMSGLPQQTPSGGGILAPQRVIEIRRGTLGFLSSPHEFLDRETGRDRTMPVDGLSVSETHLMNQAPGRVEPSVLKRAFCSSVRLS
jgi:hypothetical protein